MDIRKRKVYMNRQTASLVTQVTLDEDRNVPDAKPDLKEIITGRGHVETEELRCSGERANLKGVLQYQILYLADTEDRPAECLEGSLLINEMISLEGAADGDTVTADWVIEDLAIEQIHSRKVRIRAAITFTVTAERLCAEELMTAASAGEPLETRSDILPLTRIAVQKSESFRVAEELELGNNKPNMGELVWQEVELRAADCRPADGSLELRGELSVFVMYRADGDSSLPIQWEEYTVPVSGQLPLADSREGMIPFVNVRLSHISLTPAEDSDGELRRIRLEALLDLWILLYETENAEVICDLYSPSREVIPKEKDTEFESLLVRNSSRCRLQERLSLPDGGRILQVCRGSGRILIDETHAEEDGMVVDGVLLVNMLYVSADDEQPLRTLEESIPFHHLIEAKGLDSGCVSRLKWGLESMNIMLLGVGEAEVKATLSLELLVFSRCRRTLLQDAELVDYDPEKVRSIPGIVGYCVQPGDTLWKIAKKFYTTVDEIREENEEIGEDVKPGQKLILVRQPDRQRSV